MTKKLKEKLQPAHTKVCLNHHGLIRQLETKEGFVIGFRENETFSICLVVSSQTVEMRKAQAPQAHCPPTDTARLGPKPEKESRGDSCSASQDGTSPHPPAPAVCQNG